ncbi:MULTISPECIES: VOC family protein [Sphingomonas]|uniref:VOC family protein n=1 Tax=Sphingomonas TaxID=13687 RepID=UPI000DEEB810|nr:MULTISPECIES: VOC family protein [Sphingomonas]
MANPTGSFIWYELMSPDPDASKAFYDSVVGWDIEAKPAGEMDYRMIRRGDGGNAGGVLRLDAAMQEHGAKPMWLGYLNVDDVDQAVAAATADGAATLMPPWSVPGIGRMAMIADPTGAPMYLMKPEPPQGAPDATSDVFSVDQPKHVRWNELSSSDPDRAVDFYKRHFGWGQEGEMPMGDLGAYRFIQHGGVGIGAVMGVMPNRPEGGWTYYLGVDDIDRAAAAVTAGGGTIVHGPIEIPGGEFSLNGVDPQGAVFAVVGPRHQGAAQ